MKCSSVLVSCGPPSLLFSPRYGTQRVAFEVFDCYQAASVAGIDAPRALEVVRTDEGYGVVVEYAKGIPLGSHIAFGSLSFREAGLQIGEFARRLHGSRTSLGCDWKRRYLAYAQALIPHLPDGSAGRLMRLMESIPESQVLIHGDLHTGNLIVRGGVSVPIDLEYMGHGHPVFDLAAMRSRAVFGTPRMSELAGRGLEAGRQIGIELWQAELEGFFGRADAIGLKEVDLRLELLSELDSCCQGNRVHGTKIDKLTCAQSARIEKTVQRLCELLPRIDRLDF